MGVKGRQTFKTHLKHRSQISQAKNIKMSGSRVPVTMRDFFFDDPFFKNSWEDFDKVRDAMFTESRDMWKKFDEDFRNMACMSNNIMLESPAGGAISCPQVPDEARLQVQMAKWLDVPPALDAACPEHRLLQPHRHLQEQGQRGYPCQGGREQAGGEPGHQPVQARRAQRECE